MQDPYVGGAFACYIFPTQQTGTEISIYIYSSILKRRKHNNTRLGNAKVIHKIMGAPHILYK